MGADWSEIPALCHISEEIGCIVMCAKRLLCSEKHGSISSLNVGIVLVNWSVYAGTVALL